MQQTFLDDLSWESMGKAAVDERLREICGLSLLNELGQYLSGELQQEDMPEHLKSDSANTELILTTCNKLITAKRNSVSRS